MAKGCLEASLITGKKQVRTPVSYQLVPVRGAGIQKAQITRAGEGVEQWEGLCTIEGTKWVQPLWRRAQRFLKKLKIELLYNPAYILGLYLETA